ncbi:MAG: hypothetical protein J7M14_01245 [Planctomycetes bacterium]|nr:hypothetical protein [Planctomycetota bacterium]
MQKMQEFRLKRTGRMPLAFTGRRLAVAGGKNFAGREQVRWYELAVYETAGGQYVLEIVYRTEWRGETPHFFAAVVAAGEFAAALEGYDPLACVQGFPPTQANAAKQKNLLAHMRRQYEKAVSDLLESDGPAEHIE